MTGNLNDLHFDKLNDNPAGVTFSILEDDGLAGLQVSAAEWRHKTEGLAEKAEITDWRLIGIAQKGWSGVLLLGLRVDTRQQWCTSEVLAVAPDRSALLTRSGSLYRLTSPGIGKPGISLVLHIVWTLRQWGLGVMFRDWPMISY